MRHVNPVEIMYLLVTQYYYYDSSKKISCVNLSQMSVSNQGPPGAEVSMTAGEGGL